jgi:GDP/UDP-N,N'-diacetylbacillosamine 2-epimerase (hydrolysing)
MKVGILTSTRADFGIYLPLLKELKMDEYFDLEIIAFGTHLSPRFGMTINEIEREGFTVKHKLDTIPTDDSAVTISHSIGATTIKFSEFWKENKYNLVFALGDRYEMFAAVLAGSPINVNFAHIHAGETTLGAIDNAYRHSISLMSKYLFVSTEEYKNRAIEIIQRPDDVFNVGALSIDNLSKEKLFSISEFKKKFNIDLKKSTILTTFHPETVGFEKNKIYITELLLVLQELTMYYQIVITMPNFDTKGLMIREKIQAFGKQNEKVKLIESFGMKGYLSCMKHCAMLIGNTSSGFVEAAFFPKWVINIGKRQNGRINTTNMHSIPIAKKEIFRTVKKIQGFSKPPKYSNIYGDGNTAQRIVLLIKELYGIK